MDRIWGILIGLLIISAGNSCRKKCQNFQIEGVILRATDSLPVEDTFQVLYFDTRCLSCPSQEIKLKFYTDQNGYFNWDFEDCLPNEYALTWPNDSLIYLGTNAGNLGTFYVNKP